jgi:hypothetical protein
MNHHDFRLLSGPLISEQGCFFGFDSKEPFVARDYLALYDAVLRPTLRVGS